jgi:hypothetical protein
LFTVWGGDALKTKSGSLNPQRQPLRGLAQQGAQVPSVGAWFALASGYDWSSLGGEGKVTWTVIANKIWSGKTKEILYRAVISLCEFSHCGYKMFFFEEIGKVCFISVNSRKK